MKYSYSKSAPSASYVSQTPSRVSPVGASSFSGKAGGGGFFPFLGTFGDPDAAQPAEAEEAIPAEDSIYGYGAGYDAIAEGAQGHAAQERQKANESKGKEDTVIDEPGTDAIPRIVAEEARKIQRAQKSEPTITEGHSPEYVTAGQPEQYFTAGESVQYGSKGQRADAVYGASNRDMLLDAVYGQSGEDRLYDAIIDGAQSDMIPEWRSFEQAQDAIPNTSVSFKIREDVPVKASEPSMPAQKGVKQTGRTSLQNVQNLQIPNTSQYSQLMQSRIQGQSILSQAADLGRNFVNYATKVQSDKWQNPLQTMAIQAGASLAVAPILGSIYAAPAVSAAVAPVVNNITKITQPVQQTPANNVINFADAARKAAASAAGAAAVASQALPAAAQGNAWNASTQTYNTVSAVANAAKNVAAKIKSQTSGVKLGEVGR